MKTIIPILFFSLSIISAQARIGETGQQCRERYGKEIRADKETGMIFFQKAGFNIFAKFHEGVVVMMTIEKTEVDAINRPKPMSDTEIETILLANDDGKKWKTDGITKSWANQKEDKIAVYEVLENQLYIVTVSYTNFLAEQNKKKETEALKGF